MRLVLNRVQNQSQCWSFIRYDQIQQYGKAYINYQQNLKRKMRKQEAIILNDINKIEKNQTLLLEKAKSQQQELLQTFGQRFLVSKKVIHKNIEEALLFLQGSFANLALKDAYLTFCLENRIDLIPDSYNVLKMMISWTEYFPTLRGKPSIPLTEIMFHGNDLSSFSSLEEFISYINFISPDVLKLVKRRDNAEEQSSKKESQKYNLQKIGVQQILSFLNVALPKVLFNILLSNQMLPNQLKKQNQTYECLYKIRSLQYFLRSKTNYSNLIRILIQGLIGMELKVSQQKILMELVFRYFYAYHHDKKQIATDLFVQAYNKLDQSTRFALADEFILFFRIIRKIGKEKFANFLNQKSAWIKDVTSKINEKSLIGYQKESVKAFNQLDISDVFTVQNGKKKVRTFEILQDYSLFYFRIDVVSLDVTIRLFYHGDIQSQKKGQTLLIEQQKKSGQFKSSIIAAKRGIYSFQFDNSYSWINSKTIRYQNVIFSPLQMQSVDRHKWISSYFNDVPTNQAITSKVTNIQRAPQKKVQKEYIGTANITKNGPFLNLKVTKSNNVYEFESENEDVFVKKFNELVDSAGNVKWTINGQPLDEGEDLRDILSNPSSKASQKGQRERPKEKEKEKQVKKQKIEISLQQFKEDQSNQN